MNLLEIEKILKKKANKKVKASHEHSNPSAKKIYGVKVPILNDITKKIKEPNFGLVKDLWKGGAFEERLLASKILGRISKKDPEQAMELVKKFSKDISDWGICDTLGTQGIRQIAETKQKEFFELTKKHISSKNLWQRRFALVLLIEMSRHGFSKEEIKKLSGKVKGDKEPYVKKAIDWLNNELSKY